MTTLFTQTAHEFINTNDFSQLSLNDLCSQLAATAGGMVERAKELVKRNPDDAGKVWLTYCQATYPGFKSSDKEHPFNKTYRAVSAQIKALTATGTTAGRSQTAEAAKAMIITLVDKWNLRGWIIETFKA